MDFSKPLFRLTLPLLSLLVLLLLASRPPAGAISPLSAQATTAYVQSFIEASDVDSGDGFGTSVARSGDLLAVGATGADINGVSGGAVYLLAGGKYISSIAIRRTRAAISAIGSPCRATHSSSARPPIPATAAPTGRAPPTSTSATTAGPMPGDWWPSWPTRQLAHFAASAMHWPSTAT
jgi:hypothetical protein